MLLIVVTLVCAYLACWRATAIQGVGAVESQSTGRFASSPMPFVVYCAEYWDAGGSSEVYYLWCFAKPKKLSERKSRSENMKSRRPICQLCDDYLQLPDG